MAISYKLIQNTNEKSTYNGYFYARAVHTSTTDLDALSERVQRNCSMKQSDVLAVLTELIEVMADELQAGHVVSLGNLGYFKLGLKGTYAKTAKTFSAATNIRSVHVNFSPKSTIVKGTTTLDDGTTKVTRTRVNPLTQGVTLKMAQ